MRWALAVAGGGLTVAGLADLGINGTGLGTGNPSGSTSTTTQSFTPDYLDFLEWMQSISDKIPNKKITVSLEEEFAPYAVQQLTPAFEQYSGISATYDLLPYLSQLNSMVLAVNTQSPSYDIFSIDNQNVGSFQNAIIPYDTLKQTYPELTYSNYNPADFIPVALDYVGTYPPIAPGGSSTSSGSLGLCPFDSPMMIFFYRKDIYDNLGLSPPTTWDEYFAQVQKLPGNGTTYACVNMANGDVSVVYEYLNHLASFGGALWTIEGNNISPNLTSTECVDALENYVRFKPYADVGSSSFTWTDQFDSLASGISATALIWSDYYSWLNESQYSQQRAGNFVPAANPAGPKGSFSTFGGSGLCVSKYSLFPEAAYVWMQWATCAGLQEETSLGSYHILPTRSSVPNNSEVEAAVSSDPISYAAYGVAQQAITGATALTPFPEWISVLNILAGHLNNAWTGSESPGEALANAEAEINQQYPNLTFAQG